MKGDYKNYTIGAVNISMGKVQKKIVYYIAYAIVAVIFLMHFGFCFGSINFSESTQAAWSIPTTIPSGMRYSGTTYYASTPQEFLYALNKGSTTTIELVGNIDFDGNAYPMITRSNNIIINGHGYSILNVSTNSNSKMGLISEASANVTINDVNLEVDIDYSSSTATKMGGFVGNATNTVTINNCTVNGEISVTSSKTHYVGGFVGYSDSTINITNSINYANISTSGGTLVGGIIGYAGSTSTTLSVCANFGDIKGATGYVGGLIGSSQGKKEVSKCFNTGDITGTSGAIGGLMGYCGNAVTFSSCYNTGSINLNSTNTRRGGIVGSAASSPTFNYCYSVGSLSSTSSSGSQTVNKTVTPTHKCDPEKLTTYSMADSENAIISTPYDGGGGDSTPQTVDVYVSLSKISYSVVTIADLCSTSYSSTYSYCFSRTTTNNSDQITLSFQVWVDGQNKKTLTHSIYQDDEEKYHFEDDGVNLQLEYYYIISESTNDGPLTICSFLGDPLTMSGMGFVLNDEGFVKMSGLQLDYSGNTLKITSLLKYKGWISNANNAFFHEGGMRPGVVQVGSNEYYYINEIIDSNFDTQTVTINNTTKTIGNSTHLTSNSDIKNKSLGSNYTTNSSINNGYPFLKDFYWMYA